jgi:RHS repeat-associated protein
MIKSISSSNGTGKRFEYDELNRLQTRVDSIDNNNKFTASYNYLSTGEIGNVVLNSAVTMSYQYNTYGYVDQVRTNNQLVWDANSVNEYGDVDNFTLGNQVNTVISYDQYGFVDGISSTKGGTYLQNWSYDFNNITGNLTGRTGLNSSGSNVSESFTYDDLNRLVTYMTGQDTLSVTYDGAGYGNITAKTDVGTYDYTGGVHNVTSVTDPTELMQNLPKQFIDYTKSGKVSCITDTLATDEVRELNFIYGPDENRVKTLLTVDGAVVKTKYFALGQYEKEIDSTGNVRELYYISGTDGVVAVLEKKNNQDSIFYIHKDYLGSYEVISNQNGTVKERYNFDPWGRRRNSADWSYDNVSSSFFIDRGFTGHEHLDQFNLINMNGRVYDPLMAMFLSPDNFVQSPDLTQNLNRYTYCLNNPLKFTDPSGYNYLQYMQQHYQNFDYRGGYYSEGTYYQASMGGGHGGYAPTTNISYDATHPHDLWSVGPGQGLNGNGLNGSYYDYYTGQYRSTS